jgi:hypothetical protein
VSEHEWKLREKGESELGLIMKPLTETGRTREEARGGKVKKS